MIVDTLCTFYTIYITLFKHVLSKRFLETFQIILQNLTSSMIIRHDTEQDILSSQNIQILSLLVSFFFRNKACSTWNFLQNRLVCETPQFGQLIIPFYKENTLRSLKIHIMFSPLTGAK